MRQLASTYPAAAAAAATRDLLPYDAFLAALNATRHSAGGAAAAGASGVRAAAGRGDGEGCAWNGGAAGGDRREEEVSGEEDVTLGALRGARIARRDGSPIPSRGGSARPGHRGGSRLSAGAGRVDEGSGGEEAEEEVCDLTGHGGRGRQLAAVAAAQGGSPVALGQVDISQLPGIPCLAPEPRARGKTHSKKRRCPEGEGGEGEGGDEEAGAGSAEDALLSLSLAQLKARSLSRTRVFRARASLSARPSRGAPRPHACSPLPSLIRLPDARRSLRVRRHTTRRPRKLASPGRVADDLKTVPAGARSRMRRCRAPRSSWSHASSGECPSIQPAPPLPSPLLLLLLLLLLAKQGTGEL